MGLREFQRSFYTKIKQAPIILTRNDKPFMVVMKYKDFIDLTKPEHEELGGTMRAEVGNADNPTRSVYPSLTAEEALDEGDPRNYAGFAPKSEMTYRGVPVISDETIPDGELHVRKADGSTTIIKVPKPTLWERIKYFLNKKIA